MARQRNPRRVVLEAMRVIAGNLRNMQRLWDVRSKVYGETAWAEGCRWRDRRPDEYPENRVEDWHRLALFMGAIERDAREVREYAEHQIAELAPAHRLHWCEEHKADAENYIQHSDQARPS